MGIDITVVLGAFAGMLTGFFAIAKVMLSQASKDREADRQERKDLTGAIKDMAGASGRVADATRKSALEAKQRNGHLAELIIQSNEKTALLAQNAVSDITAHLDGQIKDNKDAINKMEDL